MRGLFVFLVVVCAALAARARDASEGGQGVPVVVSVHIGVNEPPADSGLAPLQYADDDAARFFELFSSHAARSFLFGTLDRTTTAHHPQLQGIARPARKADVVDAFARARALIEQARASGQPTQLVVTYSGHGILRGTSTSLALLDGVIDRAFLDQQVLAVRADATHLIVDACHGAGLVGGRGFVEEEGSARTLSRGERAAALGDDLLVRNPHVGALFAASPDQETHEWSDVEGGVFSHEVLSALQGAADINVDGVVGYGEIAAFVAAANRDVPDPRASLHIVALPPRANPQVALMDHRWLHNVAFLEARAQSLGHFRIERDDGLRVLDAHFGATQPMRVLLPADTDLWIRTDDGDEAFLKAPVGGNVPVATLAFARSDAPRARGAVENALKRGLFRAPLTTGYYEGFVDSRGLPRVPTEIESPFAPTFAPPRQAPAATAAHELPAPEPATGPRPPPLLALASGSVAALSGVLAVGFGTLTVVAISEYNSTTLQRDSVDALNRAIGFGVATAATGLVTAGSGCFAAALLVSNE